MKMNVRDAERAEQSLEKFGQYEVIYGEHGALCFAFAWTTAKRYLGYEEKINMAYCHAFAIALHSLIEENEVDPQALFNHYCAWFSDMIKEEKAND